MRHKLSSSLLKMIGLASSLLLVAPAYGYSPNENRVTSNQKPLEIQGVGIDEKTGTFVDKNVTFTNDQGKKTSLGQILSKGKPVVLSIVYFNCPSLCNFHLNGVTAALKKINWQVGKEFEVVALSMAPTEESKLAGAKKASYIKEYGVPDSASGWHFLTGDKESIKKVSDSVGFRFKWIESQNEYAHSAAAIVLTPEGKISRYLHGVEFEPQNMKLALVEASDGQVGTIADKILMYCFQFDPNKKKYTLYSYNIMRAGAGVAVIVLGAVLIPVWIRERRKNLAEKGEA